MENRLDITNVQCTLQKISQLLSNSIKQCCKKIGQKTIWNYGTKKIPTLFILLLPFDKVTKGVIKDSESKCSLKFENARQNLILERDL